MKNSFGNSLQTTLFGESHGSHIGVVLDGLAPGIKIDRDFIDKQLSKRRPSGVISTARVEADEYSIVSGVYKERTTGTPVCIIIPNNSQKSADYEKEDRIARPGHADYTASCKYHGYEDFRGGGHFSGRITAPLVAAGAIVMPALAEKGIKIGTHISKLGSIEDRSFVDYFSDIEYLSNEMFPTLDKSVAEAMQERIKEVAAEGDSIGGVLETVITGLPTGVGEPWFDSVESILSHALYSIPAIKGVQFGKGFDDASLLGSEYNDALYSEDGNVFTRTNNNGGINGGITNGMPVLFKCAVKPTPSIFKEQDSISLKTGNNEKLNLKGRHDPAIIHRARVVVDSMVALVIYDMLAQRFGTDFFGPKDN